MAKPAAALWIFILCTTRYAQVQCEVSDYATKHIQEMTDQLTESLRALSQESEKAKESVQSAYRAHESNLKQHTEDTVQRALEELSARECHPKHRRALRSVPENILEGFGDCVNFAKTLADFQETILGITSSADDADAIVCQSLRRVGLCRADAGVLEKVGCVTGDVIDMAKEIKDKVADVYGSISTITTAAKDIAAAFEQCFHTSKNSASATINAVAETYC